MASDADIHRIGFRQSGLCAGMRTVAIGAVACRSRMLDSRLFDLFRFVGVAGKAQVLHVGLCQNHLPVLGWRVAGLAALLCKRWVLELGHQLGCRGLVRVVALETVRCTKRLVPMSFL